MVSDSGRLLRSVGGCRSNTSTVNEECATPELLFSSSPPNDPAQDIYAFDIATKRFLQLTHDAGRNDFPSWSPDGRSIADLSEGAAIEFAVQVLGVKDIVVCGHSECGAMRALIGGAPAAGRSRPSHLEFRAQLEVIRGAAAAQHRGRRVRPGLQEGLDQAHRLHRALGARGIRARWVDGAGGDRLR